MYEFVMFISWRCVCLDMDSGSFLHIS